MRKRLAGLFVGIVLALGLGPVGTPATAFCDESEGCTPCGGPRVVVDGKNTRVEWIAC